MENEKLAEFFRTECDYTSLVEEIMAAQTQMLNIHEKISQMPEVEQPGTNYITDLFFTLGQLVPLLRPSEHVL